MEKDQKFYQFWLHNLPDIGDAAICRLLTVFSDAESVYRASVAQLCGVLK